MASAGISSTIMNKTFRFGSTIALKSICLKENLFYELN